MPTHLLSNRENQSRARLPTFGSGPILRDNNMNNIIEWQIPDTHIAEAAAKRTNAPSYGKCYDYELDEDAAFFITTYFTNMWMHAHEHTANVAPGTFIPRSYKRNTMSLHLGRYYITLKYDYYELDGWDDEVSYNDQYIANVVDFQTNDVLELYIETDYDDTPGFITSNISQEAGKALALDIIRRCKSECDTVTNGLHVDRVTAYHAAN